MDDVAVHVGEAAVDAVLAEGELFVIDAEKVKEGGVQFGNDPEMSARVVEACRQQTGKPVIAKLSPNQTDIADNARRCIEAGADALRAQIQADVDEARQRRETP